MTKFKKLYDDMEKVLDLRTLYPKAYTCVPSKELRKSKGYDRTQNGGVRNEYGDGWNDAMSKIGNMIAEVLDKHGKK